MAKYLNLTGLQTLWTKIKAVFAPKENGVYYVPGTSGYANWSANTAYAVGANVVNPSGECWTCKTAHTSGSSWASTNWNRISAVALTGTIDGVTALYAGLKIAYRFQVLGGEGSTTLNVNSLGAKTITRGTGAFYRWTIGRNGVAILVYDGSAWRFGDYDSNDPYVLTDAYCSTDAGTQAKIAISSGFHYSRHNNIPFRIYFTNANTYNGNLTLNVNSQGEKALWINGSASSSSNKTIAIGVYWCYYDGTKFQLWTDKSLWAYKYRGDGSSLTETFTAASSKANIASGDSNATIFGKIARWLGDLKALAFKDNVSDSDISGTISDNHIASATTWNNKVSRFVRNFNAQSGTATAVSDWDDMDATGLYEIAGSPAAGTGHSPESGVMTLLTVEPSSGFKVQLAMGYKTYRRYYHNVSSNPDKFGWTDWETLESQANKTTYIREYDSASNPPSDVRYPSEKAVAQQLYGVGIKPILHAEGYFNRSYGSTTWRNVGLYVNDSDTPVAQPNIYGPEGDRTGRLTGGLDSLLHETGWEPYTDFGCLDYTAIFDMVTTSTIDLDLQMADIIAHGIRKFKYRFFNYGQGLVRVRFCYSKTGSTYDDGLEIFTQEGKSTLKYYQVNVPVARYAEAEVVIPSTIHAETNSWVALMRVTNGVT